MPPNMGKLKDLQLLTDFILDKQSGYNIAELKELQNLHGTLRISGLHNIVHVENALEANMRDKKYLNELVLKWGDDIEDSQKDREVLGKLKPHANLKELVILFYGGTRSLKELRIMNMMEWREWYHIGGNIGEGGMFPNLCGLHRDKGEDWSKISHIPHITVDGYDI
ncbi:hypothetical protein M0R45_034764 [Rubus argutus]|uniref:R13L1/DRL21-like LRR repeat region domain-containing protein n=1 Tax=Rubus argutus TaxID=59490 RepID=A0AAW1VR42_RUBAR